MIFAAPSIENPRFESSWPISWSPTPDVTAPYVTKGTAKIFLKCGRFEIKFSTGGVIWPVYIGDPIQRQSPSFRRLPIE